jgi:hypothetical protein
MKTQEEEYIEVGCAKIYRESENFFRTRYCDGCVVNANHLEAIRIAYTEIAGSEDLSQLRLLVIFEGDLDISQDVGQRYIDSRIRPKKGEAFVSSNEKTRQYLNAATAVISSGHPVKVFSEVGEAEEWLGNL